MENNSTIVISFLINNILLKSETRGFYLISALSGNCVAIFLEFTKLYLSCIKEVS
ncbi:hypothetical protein IGI52_001610 [Enterococcus sp. DIV0187]